MEPLPEHTPQNLHTISEYPEIFLNPTHKHNFYFGVYSRINDIVPVKYSIPPLSLKESTQIMHKYDP